MKELHEKRHNLDKFIELILKTNWIQEIRPLDIFEKEEVMKNCEVQSGDIAMLNDSDIICSDLNSMFPITVMCSTKVIK